MQQTGKIEFHRASLADCHQVTGLAVVIDVLRAFTTAGYLFEAGVSKIILVSDVEEAFALRNRLPGSLILGEMDGIPVEGFDLGNSPSQLSCHHLQGRVIIQRTTAGTQGVIRAVHAHPVLTAALTNAGATCRYIQNLSARKVTFIQTGYFPEEGWGDEDVACADLLEARLSGNDVDLDSISARVRASRSGRHYDGTRLAFPPSDLEYALQYDRFSFAMLVTQKDGLHVMQAVPV